ncbi:MAG: resolvase [Cyanobium sp. LacPavin_0920_WC12_MAG_62_9]|nr:resolvase [Cyanobium sp. LacPavin_0920_WC12_MAG_62_9]
MTCSFDAQHLIAGLDPGRSKCGLVLADRLAQQIHQAAILSPPKTLAWLRHWHSQGLRTLVMGNGTGSKPWLSRLGDLDLSLELVDERGTTLAARQRYWELFRPRGLAKLIPVGLRMPPRDLDDIAAQLLLERQLGHRLQRQLEPVLRTWPAP